MTRGRLGPVPLLLSLASLGAVVWWALGQDRPHPPNDLEGAQALGLALLGYAAATAGRGERWHRILHHTGLGVLRRDSYSLTLVGYMANNTLPARAGDILRVFLLSPRVAASKRTVLGTVIAERLLDALALALLFAAVGYAVVGAPSIGSGIVLWTVGAVAAGLGFAGIAAARARRRPVVARARALLEPVATASRMLLGRKGLALLALSLTIWVVEAAVYLAVADAVDLELGLLGAIVVVASTNLFALLPAGPGYVGTFDAAVVLAASSLGHTGARVVSFLLLLRFVLFVPITIAGLGLFLVRHGGWARYRAVRSSS